jgi:hypothetical protein
MRPQRSNPNNGGHAMLQTANDRFRAMSAQGWTLMFMVFVSNLVIDLIKNTVRGDSTQWAQHLGMPGVQLLLVVMVIYAIMPMLIRSLSAQWFRFAVVGLTVFMGLFVGAHEISHLSPTDKPFGIFHTLDVTHHVLVVWVTVAAVRWARQGDQTAAATVVAAATTKVAPSA